MRPSSVLSSCFASLALCACKPTITPTEPAKPLAKPSEPVAAVATEPEPEPEPPAPVIYGHFRVSAPDRLIEQVREQLLPPAQRLVLHESMLRPMLGSMLGSRSGVADHIDLSRPMGCVVASPKRYDRPLACVVGYQGGLDRLVEDLGAEGYVSGGDDYAAYRIEGQPLYFNTMGEHVAVSFTPDLTAATRDRLQRDIIGSADGKDLTGTAFLGVIFEDSREQIEQFIEREVSSTPDSDAYQRAIRDAQRKQWLSYGELASAELWLDLTPERVGMGYRGTARADTPTRKSYDANRDLHHDRALLERLPAESFLLASMTFEPSSMSDDPMFGAYTQTMSALDDTGSTAALAQLLRDNLATWRDMSTGQVAVAMLKERGTLGGVVFMYRLKPDADVQSRLRESFERYRTLPADTPLPFEFTLRRGAFRKGKLRGDIATMKPNAKTRAQLKDNPAWRKLTRVLGGPPALQTAYVQQGDVLYMAIAPKKADRYIKRAMAASAGTRNVSGRKDAIALLEGHDRDSMMMMADVGEIIDWLVAIDLIDSPPGPVGKALDDVVISMRSGEPGQREVVFEVSQPLIDSLLNLAN
ncbi:MAG: hypothetical protein AAGF11_41605 [Myxococcota bacterium]